MTKKIIIITILAFFISPMLNASTGSKAVQKDKLVDAISDFNGYEGFDMVSVGSLGTSLIKSLAKMAAIAENDEDVLAAVKMIQGIKKVTIIDYEDCEKSVRDKFNGRLGRILTGDNLLMELKDGSELMKIYGVVDGDKAVVKDFVISVPSDYALICLFGSISLDLVAELAD